MVETCCCRDPTDNFASCRLTSSYCGTGAVLELAAPGDLLLVCGEWSVGEEPELYSREEEVVLPITKIIQHPSYTPEAGPGEGWDLAVYHVDDSRLKGVGDTVLPACLPDQSLLAVDTTGIFVSWKDPRPLYIEYNLDFDRTVKRYRTYELLLSHTRMDIVPCRDPQWMDSDTFYPRGAFCALDPSTESCLDTGDSGSGLVAARTDSSYAWLGPLSFYRGCDRAPSRGFDLMALQVTSMGGENPGVFTSGLCYLDWIARQYGLRSRATDVKGCHDTHGNRQDRGRTNCRTVGGATCDFNSKFPISDFYNNFNTNLGFPIIDARNLKFNQCILRALEGYTSLVFQCPLNATSLAVCPNNCLGVSASAIVAGGSVLLASTAISSFTLMSTVVGLTLAGGAVAMTARASCSGPLFCRSRSGQCCLVRGTAGGLRCPRNC